MALTAIYIAMGSARPWLKEMGVDEWPLVRDWFDKTDMQFFNSWPLKTLMILLVMNLIVVTWRRIPLTPPRYGVWCIHAGIITLICGTAQYYYYKVEGRVRIYSDPNAGPTVVDHFYDKDQRSLYVRIAPRGSEAGQEIPVEIPLPTLPRFKEYDEHFGGADALARRGLTLIEPTVEITDRVTGNHRLDNLAELVGCTAQKLKFDIIGFYPYAMMSQPDFVANPASDTTGIEVTLPSINDQGATSDWWLVASDPEVSFNNDRALMDMRHIDATPEMVTGLVDAAGKLFHLKITLPDQPVISLDVQVGQTYTVGSSGYKLKVESFEPSWSMFGTGEQAAMLQMIVTSPTQTFRRMVLQDKPVQTDFVLNAPGAGPMGKRQKKPLDTDLKIDFHVHDPMHLLPEQNNVKHTLLTVPGNTELIDISAGVGEVASEVKRFATGVEDIDVKTDSEQMTAPFAPAAAASQPVAGENGDSGDAAPAHPSVKVHLERRDHIRRVDSIQVVAPAGRDRNAEDEGDYQVLKIRVSMGDWSTVVYAPFAQDAADHVRPDRWRAGLVFPPGAIAPLQLQLGNSRRPLPVKLALNQFKLVPYDGAAPDDKNAMMKDFVSTITLSDLDSGESYVDVAKMNHPIYYGGGGWLFFQATFDNSDAHGWTGLGVGNRPAYKIMRAGCLMIFVGLAYAFYAKPIIVRRMKEKAIAKALAEGKTVHKPQPGELVNS